LTYVQRIKLLQAVREDDDRCSSLVGEGEFLPFLAGRPLLCLPPLSVPSSAPAQAWDRGRQTLKWISHGELEVLCGGSPPERRVLLHMSDTGRPCFAVSLPGGSTEAAAGAQQLTAGKFVDARAALFLLPWEEAHTMSQAFAVLHWQAVTSFCANCGVQLRTRAAGHAKECPACETVQYPLTPPVGITMITDPAETRALLVRQGRHPPGMYSCVAGFLEPGETVETCVRREVAEEVGLELTTVRYGASQHWPFTGSSLMVGCYATTEQTELDIDRAELEDARWFSAEEILVAYRRIVETPAVRLQKTNEGGLWVPPDGTVAHRLIRAWLLDRGLLTSADI